MHGTEYSPECSLRASEVLIFLLGAKVIFISSFLKRGGVRKIAALYI